MTDDPPVTEIDVDETHFVRGTLDVVYKGHIRTEMGLIRCGGG
jgi:hypothetical protein